MKGWLGFPLVRIALWVGAWALVGYYFGVVALVTTSPLMAVGVKRPMVELLSDFRHAVRRQVWMPVHGQHYVFRGTTVHVVEDDGLCRWVNLADVQKVAGFTLAERTLAVVYPGKVKAMGTPPVPHMRDDALVTHLGKINQPEVLRLRTWVERNIAVPGQKVRRNAGLDAGP